jgi:hypothetical protein
VPIKAQVMDSDKSGVCIKQGGAAQRSAGRFHFSG